MKPRDTSRPGAPVTDPLQFWARMFMRLGAVLLLLGLAPMTIDLLFLGGAGALVGVLALLTVAPLGLVMLTVGLIMWGIWKTRR